MSVSKRFDTFLSNIRITDAQVTAGKERRESAIRVLNSHYWGINNSTQNSKFVGSWGKSTRVRPPRDVDVLFELPKSVYDRFQGRSGNRQSQLLQEIKGVLANKFYSTNIKGDGPVVVVPFEAYNVEVIPAFLLEGGGYWVCMTDNGGHYKKADYDAEITAIRDSDKDTGSMTRRLIRMMKRWQSVCNVPIKSFWIELLAMDFLQNWEHKGKSSVYYDWMVRDFLKYMKSQKGMYVYAPGTYEIMNIGEAWYSRADTAHQRAIRACGFEDSNEGAAGEEWQKIFGTDIPKYT